MSLLSFDFSFQKAPDEPSSRGEEERNYSHVPGSGPCGLGSCYFRLNQLPAGSLDEIPRHHRHRGWRKCYHWEASTSDLQPENPNCSQVPRDPNLTLDGGPISLRTPLLEKQHLLSTPQGKVHHPPPENNPIPAVRIKQHSSVGENPNFTLIPAGQEQSYLSNGLIHKTIKSGLSSPGTEEGERKTAKTHIGPAMTAAEIQSLVQGNKEAADRTAHNALTCQQRRVGPGFRSPRWLPAPMRSCSAQCKLKMGHLPSKLLRISRW